MKNSNVILLLIKNHKLFNSKKFKNEDLAYDYVIENFDEIKLKLKSNNYLILNENKIKNLHLNSDEYITIIIVDSEFKNYKKFKNKIEIKSYLDKYKRLDLDEQFDYISLDKNQLDIILYKNLNNFNMHR